MWNDDAPRTWKWFVPGVISSLLLWASLVLFGLAWRNTAALLFILAVFGFGLTLTNYLWVTGSHNADVLRRRQEALSLSARQMMLEAAKGVHPETLRLLLGEQARRWGLVSGSKSPTGKPYRVLMARPRVTEDFLIYFLQNSRGEMYMSKRTLGDGDKSFDPHGLVTAYEMYDDVESLLIEEIKATRPYGPTKPGYWLKDWDAWSVGLDFMIDIDALDEVDEVEADEPAEPVEDQVDDTHLHRATAREFEKRGVKAVQASAMSGLLQTPEILAKLPKA